MTVAARTVKTLLTLLAALLFELAIPGHVSAQAWLPPKGEGNFSILYQNLFVRNHLLSDGSRLNTGRIRSSGILMDFDYGLTDKVAVNVSLPFITSKYNGPRPHQLPIDGGEYHGTFQDFRFGLRYNVRMRPLVVSPFVEGMFPAITTSILRTRPSVQISRSCNLV